MKYIINEKQNEDIKRKLPLIRRKWLIEKILNVIMDNMYVCDYDDEEWFIQAVVYEVFEYKNQEPQLVNISMPDLSEFIEEIFSGDIKEYYNERRSMCE
jgi:hypothetical protein